jgi:hypothetical protein
MHAVPASGLRWRRGPRSHSHWTWLCRAPCPQIQQRFANGRGLPCGYCPRRTKAKCVGSDRTGRGLLGLTTDDLWLRGRCEELRVICGTRGVPGTVAPFRAWRGSRDLVAQSPKLHALAVAHITTAGFQFNTASDESREAPSNEIFWSVTYDFFFGASGGTTSAGFTQFTLNGPMP